MKKDEAIDELNELQQLIPDFFTIYTLHKTPFKGLDRLVNNFFLAFNYLKLKSLILFVINFNLMWFVC